MSSETQWLIGAAFGLVLLIGGLLTRDRQLNQTIQTGDDGAHKRIDEVHERINRTRDDYVRRVDMDGHLNRIEANMREIRDETRHQHAETNKRLDSLLAELKRRV